LRDRPVLTRCRRRAAASAPGSGTANGGLAGCLRALTGAQQFCAIRSYLSTAAKHDLHFFATLVMLTEGQPWMPTAM
jgi:hypothetical protein